MRLRHCSIIFLILFAAALVPVTAKGPFHGQVGIAIEQTFGTGNPDALKRFLPDDGKVFLSIPAAEIEAGNYSANQVVTILRRTLERFRTRRFHVEGGRLPNVKRAPLKATWNYKDSRTGREGNISIYITVTSNPLKPEITSIRGS